MASRRLNESRPITAAATTGCVPHSSPSEMRPPKLGHPMADPSSHAEPVRSRLGYHLVPRSGWLRALSLQLQDAEWPRSRRQLWRRRLSVRPCPPPRRLWPVRPPATGPRPATPAAGRLRHCAAHARRMPTQGPSQALWPGPPALRPCRCKGLLPTRRTSPRRQPQRPIAGPADEPGADGNALLTGRQRTIPRNLKLARQVGAVEWLFTEWFRQRHPPFAQGFDKNYAHT